MKARAIRDALLVAFMIPVAVLILLATILGAVVLWLFDDDEGEEWVGR